MKERVDLWLTRTVHTSEKQRKTKSKISVGFPLDLTQRFPGTLFKKIKPIKTPQQRKTPTKTKKKKNRGTKGFFSQMQQSQKRKLAQ